jgi:ABC-type multidrug transport system fused ATPase/permease subunit
LEEKLERFENFGKVSKKDDGKIIKDENEEVIQVKYSTYQKLIEYAGGNKFLVYINIALMITKIGETYLTWYIGMWATDQVAQLENHNKFALVVFGMAALTSIAEFMRSKIVSIMIYKAGNKAHSEIIKSVLMAPINSFFDVTPTGLIINRFSKDLDQVESVCWGIKWTLVCFYNVMSIIIVICMAKW